MSHMISNRAFRRGLAAGFSSPFRALFEGPLRYSFTPRATDAAAWREIGSLLNQSYRNAGVEIGKKPQPYTTKPGK